MSFVRLLIIVLSLNVVLSLMLLVCSTKCICIRILYDSNFNLLYAVSSFARPPSSINALASLPKLSKLWP